MQRHHSHQPLNKTVVKTVETTVTRRTLTVTTTHLVGSSVRNRTHSPQSRSTHASSSRAQANEALYTDGRAHDIFVHNLPNTYEVREALFYFLYDLAPQLGRLGVKVKQMPRHLSSRYAFVRYENAANHVEAISLIDGAWFVHAGIRKQLTAHFNQQPPQRSDFTFDDPTTFARGDAARQAARVDRAIVVITRPSQAVHNSNNDANVTTVSTTNNEDHYNTNESELTLRNSSDNNYDSSPTSTFVVSGSAPFALFTISMLAAREWARTYDSLRRTLTIRPDSFSAQLGWRQLARMAFEANISPRAITNDENTSLQITEAFGNDRVTQAHSRNNNYNKVTTVTSRCITTIEQSSSTTREGNERVCERVQHASVTATQTCTVETQTNTIDSASMTAVLGQLRVLALTRHVTLPETNEVETQTPTSAFHECLHCDPPRQFDSADQLRSHVVGCSTTPLAVRLINGACPSCREPNTHILELYLLKFSHMLCAQCLFAMRRTEQRKLELDLMPGEHAPPLEQIMIRCPVCKTTVLKSIFRIIPN